jgi:hypothetical protein
MRPCNIYRRPMSAPLARDRKRHRQPGLRTRRRGLYVQRRRRSQGVRREQPLGHRRDASALGAPAPPPPNDQGGLDDAARPGGGIEEALAQATSTAIFYES